ncbi:sulfotransferase [Enterovibrio baiacu]|uniref:sulfotransferase n=1 Tax=Enterovibrio baiacu TaxID=2491023 RepID=UPI003D129946
MTSSLNQPLIFLGPPRSGVTLISNLVFHHTDLCWLDESFEKHPRSQWQNRVFTQTSQWRSSAVLGNSMFSGLAREFSPTPSEALSFWDGYSRDEIDFFRGFAKSKHATPIEISTIKDVLRKRLISTQRPRLALKFTGPSRLHYLSSLFPDAKFVNIVRDPASTVNSMLSTEEWEYQGKHMLWWRGAYSIRELAQYDMLRDHPIAGTAFQLNKLLQTTKQEEEELNINMLTIDYEHFSANPYDTMASILKFADLPASPHIDAAIRQNEIRCSNKVMKMPATDINTVYTWCPAS